MPGSPAPKRVAILGGGIAALTAAFELAQLNIPTAPKRYDITVYQQGWRLGGKGASGRDVGRRMRIEEHGLHVWFGAYENAFRLIRNVYRQRQDKWPRNKFEDAFKEQFGFHLAEKVGDEWSLWPFPMPHREASAPGDGTPQGRCTPRSVLSRLGSLLADYYERNLFAAIQTAASTPQAFTQSLVGVPVPVPTELRNLADRLKTVADNADPAERSQIAAEYSSFRDRLSLYMASLAYAPVSGAGALSLLVTTQWRRYLTIVAIGTAVIGGTVFSEAFVKDDWDELNNCDLREWLRQHLGGQANLADSSLVEASYDLYFSYPDGDTSKGSIEAGSMLRAAVWLLLEYKGAFMWRMRSAMGDSIFAPLYNALDSMEVKFEFFRKVKHLATDGTSIIRIELEQQASLNVAKYVPVVSDPLGDDCWPSRPRFEFLNEGKQLKSTWDRSNLESDWSTWDAKLPALTLAVGTDFDHVVLGIPLGGLTDICVDLPTFAPMLGTVKTVQTQALQVWLEQPLKWLQAPLQNFDEPPMLTTFENPIDTYADMTHLASREAWPPAVPAKHIAYFCGVLEHRFRGDPRRDPTYPKFANNTVHQQSVALFSTPSGKPAVQAPMQALWPQAFLTGSMNWKLLCGSAATGVDRLNDQYFHANIDASARYVLAAQDTSRHRLKARGSGYSNLFLAGDWVYNGLFVGCIEGAVISGKQAARALSSEPIEVVGEGTLFKKP